MNPESSSWTLITGGSRGLGYALAVEFAQLGSNLILLGRNEEKLRLAKVQLEDAFDVEVLIYQTDLSDKVALTKVCEKIIDSVDSLDTLVNNVGNFVPDTIRQEGDGELEHLMRVNLYSAYYMTKELLQKMYESKKAHIINVCSVAALDAYPGGSSYSISKFALRGFSLNLREELKDTNIAVTTVYPGAFYSDSWKDSDIPAEDLMSTQDVAKSIASVTLLSGQAVVEELILRPQKGDI